MKKTVMKFVSVMLFFTVLSLSLYSNLYAAKPIDNPAPSSTKIMETRFLNMLNHNFVYNESFDSLEGIVNSSVIALLDKRDTENDSYISEDIVNNYIYDMFGTRIDNFKGINSEFPQKEGFVYILPKGYEIYEHKAVSVTENEDGTFTFNTDVTIKSHDGIIENAKGEAMFVKNPNSVFGYNIVRAMIHYSEIAL